MHYTIRLSDDTCGALDSAIEPAIGDTVTVQLHDEGGNQIEVEGEVAEILEQEDR